MKPPKSQTDSTQFTTTPTSRHTNTYVEDYPHGKYRVTEETRIYPDGTVSTSKTSVLIRE